MRWFKHMSALSRDEGVMRYVDACGGDAVEGYGFLMLVMEAIAEQIDAKSPTCGLTCELRQWSRITYSHHHRVTKYMGKLVEIGWVTVEKVGSRIEVRIPKLLEWRDEYQRKSGLRPDKIATEQKSDRKQDSEQKESNNRNSRPATLSDADFQILKTQYPKLAGEQSWDKAKSALQDRLSEGCEIAAIMAGVTRYKRFCDFEGRTGSKYVKFASTFLGPDKYFLKLWEPSDNYSGGSRTPPTVADLPEDQRHQRPDETTAEHEKRIGALLTMKKYPNLFH